MDRITELKLKKYRRAVEGNLDWAAKFPHNPVLEEKFLRQAIEAEAKIAALNG